MGDKIDTSYEKCVTPILNLLFKRSINIEEILNTHSLKISKIISGPNHLIIKLEIFHKESLKSICTLIITKKKL